MIASFVDYVRLMYFRIRYINHLEVEKINIKFGNRKENWMQKWQFENLEQPQDTVLFLIKQMK